MNQKQAALDKPANITSTAILETLMKMACCKVEQLSPRQAIISNGLMPDIYSFNEVLAARGRLIFTFSGRIDPGKGFDLRRGN